MSPSIESPEDNPYTSPTSEIEKRGIFISAFLKNETISSFSIGFCLSIVIYFYTIIFAHAMGCIIPMLFTSAFLTLTAIICRYILKSFQIATIALRSVIFLWLSFMLITALLGILAMH